MFNGARDSLKFFSLILITFFISACASGYKQFYMPAEGLTHKQIDKLKIAIESQKEPLVEYSSSRDADAILKSYFKRGFSMIGSSEFTSGQDESDSAAVSQAKSVGADLVLIISPKYAGSVTSTVAINKPTTTKSYTTSSATAYGSSGPVTAYGKSVTTTYGNETSYIPLTVHRANYAAVYFIKEEFIFGGSIRDLNDEERAKLQSNKGAVVEQVVDSSPAFDADMLNGDVIKSIDGNDIKSPTDLMSQFEIKRGKKVVLEIFRNGKKVTKVVKLNN